MFISRPSEPRTVLLWGDRWWFAGTGVSAEFADLGGAVDVLVAHYANEPKPVRIRLIFQPDALETEPVACPQADRATLAAALAGEFPSLCNPQCAWSHEHVLPIGGDFATLLHFETTPGLIALATELARRGLAVESAWPMATFLHALPKEWSDSGAVTVVAVQAQRAVAYRHPADGVRSVPVWLGESAVAEVGEWLGEVLAQSPEEPVLLVCADAETATALGSFVSEEGYPGVEQITLNEALARPGPFPRYHPAQLLPRTPLFTAQRFLVAASIALLLAGSWMGTGIVRNSLAERAATRDQQTKLSALRTEVAQLRENAAEIAALRRSLEGGAAGPPCGALLEAVATTVPASITLTSLRVTGRTVAIEGWVAPGSLPTAVEDWRSRLAPANAPWTVKAKAGAAGAFTLNGGFRL
jgi:hypothetical protein